MYFFLLLRESKPNPITQPCNLQLALIGSTLNLFQMFKKEEKEKHQAIDGILFDGQLLFTVKTK